MAKKVIVEQPQPQVGYAHVFANEIGETIAIIRPFVVWPLLAIGAALLHHFWADSYYAITFLVMSAVLIPVLVWHVSKHHTIAEFLHIVLTSVLIAGILGMVDLFGWTKATAFAMLFAVPMICLTWSIRGGIAARDEAKGQHLGGFFDAAGLPDTHIKLPKKEKPKAGAVSKWWNRGEEPVAAEEPLPDGKQRKAADQRRLTGTVHLPPGGVPDDVVKNLRRVESAAGYPPNTLSVTQNPDHAGIGNVVMSDPRIIKKLIPYPGPSHVGGSIASPISVGLYQDGTEVEFDVPGNQVQVMGQTGSGKSLGAGWGTLAEVVTRYDVAVWAIDVTKGYQTLGPLETALHRLATEDDSACELLEDVQRLIKPRTNYLAENGLSKWQKDCGLQYMMIWLEEVPDIVRAVGPKGKEAWMRSVKAARSAGIGFWWSLQRADFREIPTITRGQAGKWCFGVSDEKEAKFGLTTIQQAAGCQPQLWGRNQPGTSYIDIPGIPVEHVSMPMRAWYWGEDATRIKAHAEQYPASARPYDAVTMALFEDNAKVPLFPATSPVKIPMVKPDPEKIPIDDARAKVRAWLLKNKDRTITAADIPEMIKGTGFTRTWGYKVMRELTAQEFLERTTKDDGVTYLWKVTP